MGKDELIVGFDDFEKQRVKRHLEKLLPHLETNRFVIVGGLAIRFHLISRGLQFQYRQFNDLDIIAENKDVVKPSVTNGFLVYHYHEYQDNSAHEDRFYVVLADEETRIKIDIFDSKPCEPNKVITVPFGDYNLKVVSAEDQLVKTVLDVFRVTNGQTNDPKQFSDAEALIQIADIETAEKYWKNKKLNSHPTSMIEAFRIAKEYANKHPEVLVEKPYRKSRPYTCKNCVNTSNFPLTPMDKIYKVLGYVE